MADVRTYAAEARSTETLGRILCSARNHHLMVDGPAWNGFPGEAVTPGELFVGAVASCAIELVQMFARDDGIPLAGVEASIHAELDPDDQPHPEHRLFNRVRMAITLRGVTDDQAVDLVDRFKGR